MNKTINLAGCTSRNTKDAILLLHRHTPKRNQWEIPGGKQKTGESLQATATREVKEELGIVVEIQKEIGHQKFIEDNQEYQYTWFEAKISSGRPEVKEKEVFDKFKYFNLNDLMQMKTQLSQNTFNYLKHV